MIIKYKLSNSFVYQDPVFLIEIQSICTLASLWMTFLFGFTVQGTNTMESVTSTTNIDTEKIIVAGAT